MPDILASPLDALCCDLGLSLPELARASGCTLSLVYLARAGSIRIPKRVLSFLAECSFSPDDLQRQQDEFRDSRRRELVSKITQLKGDPHAG